MNAFCDLDEGLSDQSFQVALGALDRGRHNDVIYGHIVGESLNTAMVQWRDMEASFDPEAPFYTRDSSAILSRNIRRNPHWLGMVVVRTAQACAMSGVIRQMDAWASIFFALSHGGVAGDLLYQGGGLADGFGGAAPAQELVVCQCLGRVDHQYFCTGVGGQEGPGFGAGI